MVAPVFVVEDGTGIDTANAYGSVADVDQFHTNAGNTWWNTLSLVQKESAIVRATFFIDKRFGPKFRGTRRRRTQALQWPRLGAYDNDGFYIDALPIALLRGMYEYAIRAAKYQTLMPDPARPTNVQDLSQDGAPQSGDVITGQVRNRITRIGPLEIEKQYITNAEIQQRWRDGTSRASQSTAVDDYFIPEYPEADVWLEQILRSPFGGATLSRGD